MRTSTPDTRLLQRTVTVPVALTARLRRAGAEDCAADGVCEFLFCAPPLPISKGRRLVDQPDGDQVKRRRAGARGTANGHQSRRQETR